MMSTVIQNMWQSFHRPSVQTPPSHAPARAARPQPSSAPPLDLAPNDPLVAYLESAPNPVEVNKLELDSPALRALKAAGVHLIVPLVSHGELIGLLNLGPRLSDQDYSTDDRRLLNNLATQAAPAVQVAQLVRQQQIEFQERERLEQEMRVARLIQQTLLPKELPALAGWQVGAYYQPARAVGGDFYDFVPLSDGRHAFVIGDVTDKGVPAALVMATTRGILRAATQRLTSPGQVLERVNDLLCPDIPPKMFVTCLCAVLDPDSGRLVYANAGHDLPYWRTNGQAVEMRATGMPLGLIPGMTYEEKELVLGPGESVLFYSDGIVEAHNPQREMFSFPRLQRLVGECGETCSLIHVLLDDLAQFTGADWEQEDDVTMVSLERQPLPIPESTRSGSSPDSANPPDSSRNDEETKWQTLAEFNVPSEAGNEQQVMQRVGEAVQALGMEPAKIEQLKTAVAEAAMNAIEHGNAFRAELPVVVQVRASDSVLAVCITDEGGGAQIPEPEIPDLEAKLEGLQSPRGWGLFLIENMVDKMNIIRDESHHTVELILYRGGDKHASRSL